jgi:hypothetical protein
MASMNESKEEFVKVTCGEHCGEDNQRCMMVRHGEEIAAIRMAIF